MSSLIPQCHLSSFSIHCVYSIRLWYCIKVLGLHRQKWVNACILLNQTIEGTIVLCPWRKENFGGGTRRILSLILLAPKWQDYDLVDIEKRQIKEWSKRSFSWKIVSSLFQEVFKGRQDDHLLIGVLGSLQMSGSLEFASFQSTLAWLFP